MYIYIFQFVALGSLSAVILLQLRPPKRHFINIQFNLYMCGAFDCNLISSANPAPTSNSLLNIVIIKHLMK